MTSSPTLPAADFAPADTLGIRGRWLESDDPGVLVGETWVSPGGGAGPLHVHLRQAETFHVLDGAITVRLGRSRHVVRAGETFHVPAGAPHTFVNHTDAEAHVTATFSPPGRIADVCAALEAAGGKPTLRETARIMGELPEDFFYLAYVPVALQRAIGALIRRLG